MSNVGTKVLTDTFAVPPSAWELSRASGHSVQFYEDESFLIEALSNLIGTAIIAGDFALLVATRRHAEELFSHLADCGLDPSIAAKQGRLVVLDAVEILSQITIDRSPDQAAFDRVVGGKVAELAAAAKKHDRRLVAFGEMVGLLCGDGNSDAAIQLERFWNKLAESFPFHLHCAYCLNLFSSPNDANVIERICAEHNHTVPSERYSSLSGEE